MFYILEKTDNTIKLARNENYWNESKKPLLTQINITLYENIGEMYTAFKTGYIDIIDVCITNVEDYIGSLRIS